MKLAFASEEELFITYDQRYASVRMKSYILRYNQGILSPQQGYAQLKKFFKSRTALKYLKKMRVPLKKAYRTTLLLEENELQVFANGELVANITAMDPINSTFKINSLSVSFDSNTPIKQIHQQMQDAVENQSTALWNLAFPKAHAASWANQPNFVLWLLLPLAVELQQLTFEHSLKLVSREVCLNPSVDAAKKFPYESHWLRKIQKQISGKYGSRTICSDWAEKQVAGGKTLGNERLLLLCSRARTAMACVPRTRKTPFGLKKLHKKTKIRQPARATRAK